MDIADIQAAPVTKVATGAYRIEGDSWSIDVAATSKTDATAKAVAAFTPPVEPPAAADVVLGALETVDASTATVADVITAIKTALNTAQATPLDPTTGQPLTG